MASGWVTNHPARKEHDTCANKAVKISYMLYIWKGAVDTPRKAFGGVSTKGVSRPEDPNAAKSGNDFWGSQNIETVSI